MDIDKTPKTRLVLPTGRSIAEVSFPAYSRKVGGTCDFMTALCRKQCVLQTGEWERKALEFFEDNPVHIIVRKILKEINQLNATILSWFIGSGDCPERLTSKLIEIMREISSVEIPQNGFTRNQSFWLNANKIDGNVRIALTVEKDDKDFEWWIQRHDIRSERMTDYLIAEPDYRKRIVNIRRFGMESVFAGCGSGWVKTIPKEGKIVEEFVEDCSLCLKDKVGCYGIQ